MLAFEPAARPGTRELAARLPRCSPDLRSGRRTRAAVVAAFVVLAISTLFFAHRTQVENPPFNAAPDKSIAVLPFENRSEDKANAYFAEGIQDEILTRLSKIADLKVISRTSTQHYKSAPENLPEIARQLGVAHILEGSVQKSGNAVRVNVQLINAATDSHVWADTFDRKLTDIFLVESEVAKAIAEQLRARFSPRRRLPSNPARLEISLLTSFIGKQKTSKMQSRWTPKLRNIYQKRSDCLSEQCRAIRTLFPAQCLLARVRRRNLFLRDRPDPVQACPSAIRNRRCPTTTT